MIPRVFHRIWLGGQPPAESAGYAQTFLDRHPGWTMREWSEDDLPPLVNQNLYDRAEDLTSGNVWQMRSDIARYEILYTLGGVYIDHDFECLRNIEPLIAGARSFAAWEEQDRWIANGLMGAEPSHPFIHRLIDWLPESVGKHKTKRPNHSTGPRYLTRMHKASPGLNRVLSQKLIYPYSYKNLKRLGADRPNRFPGAYLVHHWNNQRRVQGL